MTITPCVSLLAATIACLVAPTAAQVCTEYETTAPDYDRYTRAAVACCPYYVLTVARVLYPALRRSGTSHASLSP